MTYKRIMLIVITCILSVSALIALIKVTSPNANASQLEPLMMEAYLVEISASLHVLKWVLGAAGCLFGSLIGVIIYAYHRDMSEVKEHAGEAKQKADSAFTEINEVKRDFLSTTNHDRACPLMNARGEG